VSFDPKSDGLYATYKVGADSVTKKLDSKIDTNTILNMVKNTSAGGSPSVTYIVPSDQTCNFMFIGSNYHAANLKVSQNGASLPLINIYDYCPLYDGCIISIANDVKCAKGDKIVCTVGSTRSVGDSWTPQVAILPY